ncbi:MAG: hypothetical protein K1Y02_26435 [Candidatus Hydrogenedentes bacterium]|nr:hypothetical protein [Candidatus Hydrogenedentota bacterium]
MARTLTLFSEVEGVILQGGKPIPGVEVERRYVWHWKDQKGEDRAITGQDGRFRFPAITGSSFLGSLIPHEPVVQQSITLRHGGGELLLWKFTKHNYDATGEIPGRPLRMRCDVGDKPAYHLVDEKLKLGYSGICTLE